MEAEKSTPAPASGRRAVARLMWFGRLILIHFALVSGAASPAKAETSAEVEIKSDDRFRGRSMSGGEPVIDADISVDLASGLYAGASATFILSGQDRAGFQGVDGFVGYATRISDGVTIDVGAAGYVFTERYSGNARNRYAEVYAGVSTGGFAAYLHYAPRYFDKDTSVLYADLNFARPIGADFTLQAHVGLLVQTAGTARLGGRSTRYDTRLALSRPLFGLDTEVAWTFAGPDDRYFHGPWSGNSALVVSVSKHF